MRLSIAAVILATATGAHAQTIDDQTDTDAASQENEELTLVQAPRITWHLQPKDHADNIVEVSCHPDFNDARFKSAKPGQSLPTDLPDVVDYIRYRSDGQGGWIRKTGHEALEVADDGGNLGLLQHDLGHPHPVWGAVLLPGQIMAAVGGVPGHQGLRKVILVHKGGAVPYLKAGAIIISWLALSYLRFFHQRRYA